MTTAADWLEVADGHLPAELVSPAGRRRALQLARRLPGDALTVLEAPLGAGATGGVADLSIRVAAPHQAAQAAALPGLPSATTALLRRFADGGHELRSISSLWLEFDLGRHPYLYPGLEIPPPVVCARFEEPPEPARLLDAILPALHGHPLPALQRWRAAACLGAITPPAHLLYAFSLAARGQRAIRLEIFGLFGREAERYLASLGEPELALEAAGVLPLLAGADRAHLSFDLDEEGRALPRLGISASMIRLPRREPRWRELVDRLVAAGLCTAAQRDGMLAWPGQDTFWTAPDRWPLETAGPRGFCARALSHVKLVCRPGKQIEAKVYLIVQYLSS